MKHSKNKNYKKSKKQKKTKKIKDLRGGNSDTPIIIIWDKNHGKNNLYKIVDNNRYPSDELILALYNKYPDKNLHIFGEGFRIPTDIIGKSTNIYDNFKQFVNLKNIILYPEVHDFKSACKKIGGGLGYLNLFLFKTEYEDLKAELIKYKVDCSSYINTIQYILDKFPEYENIYYNNKTGKVNNETINARLNSIYKTWNENISVNMPLPINKFMQNCLEPYMQLVNYDIANNTNRAEKTYDLIKDSLFMFNNNIVGMLTLILEDKDIRKAIHMPNKDNLLITNNEFSKDKLKHINDIRDENFINHINYINNKLDNDDIIVIIMGASHKAYDEWNTQLSPKIEIENTDTYEDWIKELKDK